MKCTGSKITLDSDLTKAKNIPSGKTLDGAALNWAVSPSVAAWTALLTGKAKVIDLDVSTLTKVEHTVTVSGPVKVDSKTIPVIYKEVKFTVGDCKPLTTFKVNGAAIKAAYP